jgi:ADP-ribosylglycohydrolase
MSAVLVDAPIRGYWVEPNRLIAGEYPGHRDPKVARKRVEQLVALGVSWFIDLTRPDELPNYDAFLPTTTTGEYARPVIYSRRPIRDHDVPEQPSHMVEILDEIDEALAAGHCVYVHCRAGIGRTGTVIGCHLVRRIGDAVSALARLDTLWTESGRYLDYPRSPETAAQLEYVQQWREGRPPPAPGIEVGVSQLQDRYRGLCLGLAIGDALAAPVQHRRLGTFTAVGDIIGGGPYDVPRGGWTDDTAVPLLLAESLMARGRFEASHFMTLLATWQRTGVGSATGQCLGITATMAKMVAQAQWSGKPLAGSHDPKDKPREPLVRIGVAVAAMLDDPERAIDLASEVARPTHQSPIVLDACRYAAAVMVGALTGVAKTTLLDPDFTPVEGLWTRRPLKPEVRKAIAVDPNKAPEPARLAAMAGGDILEALKLLRWSLARGSGYRDTVLAAVNLGADADVNGALVGQFAGALYGAQGIPAHWRMAVLDGERVSRIADELWSSALRRATVV